MSPVFGILKHFSGASADFGWFRRGAQSVLFRAVSGSFIRPVLLSTHVSSQDQKSVCGAAGAACVCHVGNFALYAPLQGPIRTGCGFTGVRAVNFNAATVCENGLSVFLHLGLVHRRTFVYVETTRFASRTRSLTFEVLYPFWSIWDCVDLWSHCLLIPISKLAFTRAMRTRRATFSFSFVLPQSLRTLIRLIQPENTKSALKVVKLFMKRLLNVIFSPLFLSFCPYYPLNRIEFSVQISLKRISFATSPVCRCEIIKPSIMQSSFCAHWKWLKSDVAGGFGRRAVSRQADRGQCWAAVRTPFTGEVRRLRCSRSGRGRQLLFARCTKTRLHLKAFRGGEVIGWN